MPGARSTWKFSNAPYLKVTRVPQIDARRAPVADHPSAHCTQTDFSSGYRPTPQRFLEVFFFRPFALLGEMARSEAATELSLTRGRISFAREGTISSAGFRFAL
jgi:hypothetical protein